MIDLLKLLAALLAIYFGVLGIRGSNNVDSDGRYTVIGKRAMAAFLVFSMIGIGVTLAESLEKSRETDTANRRYVEATARDSVNLQRSAMLLRQSDTLFNNILRLDSLARLQLEERTRGLEQQQALMSSQHVLLRSANRALYPYEPFGDTTIAFTATIVLDSTLAPVRLFMDSIWTLADNYVPTLIREQAGRPFGSTATANLPVNYCDPPLDPSVGRIVCAPKLRASVRVEYTVDPDTTRPARDRLRAREFVVRFSDLSYHKHPVAEVLPREAELEFYCCGLPQRAEAPFWNISLLNDYFSSELHGFREDRSARLSLRPTFLTGIKELSMVDFAGSTTVLRIDDVPVRHLGFSLLMPLGTNRNLFLDRNRWISRSSPECRCLTATVLPADIEFFPGELTGGPLRPIQEPIRPLQLPP